MTTNDFPVRSVLLVSRNVQSMALKVVLHRYHETVHMSKESLPNSYRQHKMYWNKTLLIYGDMKMLMGICNPSRQWESLSSHSFSLSRDVIIIS